MDTRTDVESRARCANCRIRLRAEPVERDGRIFCCDGCAGGGPCCC